MVNKQTTPLFILDRQILRATKKNYKSQEFSEENKIQF